MAAITLTIPDAQVNRIRDAFRIASGNPTAGPPELKAWLRATMIQMVKDVEGRESGEAARATAIAAVESQLTIT